MFFQHFVIIDQAWLYLCEYISIFLDQLVELLIDIFTKNISLILIRLHHVKADN